MENGSSASDDGQTDQHIVVLVTIVVPSKAWQLMFIEVQRMKI